jgi:hypothetical protein
MKSRNLRFLLVATKAGKDRAVLQWVEREGNGLKGLFPEEKVTLYATGNSTETGEPP